MNHERAECDYENDDGKLDDDDGVVGARALANSVNQKNRDRGNDQKCGKIKCDRIAGDGGNRRRGKIRERFAALRDDALGRVVIVHQPHGKLQAKQTAEEPDEITRPTNRHRHVANGVFENEVPADNPGDDFTERRVGISVGGTGHRNHRRQLGITKRRETAGDSSDHKRKHHRGPRARPPEHERGMAHPRLEEIQNRRFPD